MGNNIVYSVAIIAICALVTLLTRALPFLVFGTRPLPGLMRYLGNVLPPAIMVILVCYCLRNIDFTSFPFGLAEILSCLAVGLLQWFRKNIYLSILVGTILYMVLIRTVFPV